MFSAVYTRAAPQLICEAWVDTTEVPPFPSVCLLLAASGPAFTLSRAGEVQEGRGEVQRGRDQRDYVKRYRREIT